MPDVFEPVAVSIMLSDLVIREQGTGKYSLIGCFNGLNFLNVPAFPPPFFITVSLTNMPSSTRAFDVTVRIEEPATAHILTSIASHIEFQEPFVVTKESIFDVPLPMMPFPVHKAGIYKIAILVNGEAAGHRNLPVTVITGPAQPQK